MFVLALIAAVNVIVLALGGYYDFRIGPLHLVAHDLFKPLLWLNGALLTAILAGRGDRMRAETLLRRPALFAAVAGILTILSYSPSFATYFEHNDWDHHQLCAGLSGWRGFASLFTTPRADGFYRPLGFASLWLDHAIFESRAWGYHLDSVFWHLLNALLAWRLFRALRIEPRAAAFAAAAFALAAVNAEAVGWPAARFELVAAAFILAALAAAARVVDAKQPPRASALAAAVLFYSLALLSKETAYATLPLVLVLWGIGRAGWRRVAPLIGALALITAVAVAIRFAVYGGLGGYVGAGGHSLHFAITWRTFTGLFTRVLAVPEFGFNSSVVLPWWSRIAVLLFAAVAAVAACSLEGRRTSRDVAVLGAAVASGLPAMNLVGWVNASMFDSRMLYLPSLWVLLFLMLALERSRFATPLLWGLLIANALGTGHNVWVQRDMQARAEASVERVAEEVRRSGAREVRLSVPADANGMPIWRDELIVRIRNRTGAVVRTSGGDAAAPAFAWNERQRMLVPAP